MWKFNNTFSDLDAVLREDFFFLYYVVLKAKSKHLRVKDCENKRIIMKASKKCN